MCSLLHKEALFKKIYSAHLHKIQYFAFSYLNNTEEAKCVAHEVFIRLWDKRNEVDFSKDILPFLFVITKNRCLNILNKRKVVREYTSRLVVKSNEDLNYLSLIGNNCENIYSLEIESIVNKTINELPEKIKTTFILKKYKNLKHEEIAKIQQISVKTVEYRIMVALKLFRKRLKDYLPLLSVLLSLN